MKRSFHRQLGPSGTTRAASAPPRAKTTRAARVTFVEGHLSRVRKRTSDAPSNPVALPDVDASGAAHARTYAVAADPAGTFGTCAARSAQLLAFLVHAAMSRAPCVERRSAWPEGTPHCCAALTASRDVRASTAQPGSSMRCVGPRSRTSAWGRPSPRGIPIQVKPVRVGTNSVLSERRRLTAIYVRLACLGLRTVGDLITRRLIHIRTATDGSDGRHVAEVREDAVDC